MELTRGRAETPEFRAGDASTPAGESPAACPASVDEMKGSTAPTEGVR